MLHSIFIVLFKNIRDNKRNSKMSVVFFSELASPYNKKLHGQRE